VPIFELAKPIATATKHRATVNTIVLVFMFLLIDKRIVELIEARAILVALDKFSKSRRFGQIGRPGFDFGVAIQ
jgi:hypothetical protein